MERLNAAQAATESFVARLKASLQEIHQEDCPHVENPPGCEKRASVAVVLRIRPKSPQQAIYNPEKCCSTAHTFQESLDFFFSQTWVQEGEPEVLLIKRAARAGDRWTSHIALPGGKREPGDSDDRATSARETREETGLEVDTDYCLRIGNLPERVITTAWGEVPLMVLCPFVYLQMRHDLPPLALQPSEVHSTHWVTLTGILSPSLRRDVRCDISDRFTRHRTPFLRILIRAIAGQLIFGAVKLKPTESLYCRSLSAAVAERNGSLLSSVVTANISQRGFLGESPRYDEDDQPLLLWGLTLGIMADVLEMIDSKATSKLWSWPTFSPWDIRVVIWLLNRKFQSRKIKALTTISRAPNRQSSDDIQIGTLDDTTYSTSVKQRGKGLEAGITWMMLLAGYTDRLRRAVIAALLFRLAFGAAFTTFLIRRWRSRHT